MTTVILRAVGDVDPAEAWDRYYRPARWSDWSPQIRRVQTTGDRLIIGLTGTVVGPLGFRVPFTVEKVDVSTRTWSWRAGFGPATVHLDHAVLPRAGGGTETTLRIRSWLPVVAGYVPLAQWALSKLVAP